MAEHFTVFGRRTTIAHRVKRNTVHLNLRDQLICDRRGKWLIHQRAKVFCSFITLNALFGVISSFAFWHARHDTADTTITLVQQREIVSITIRKRNTTGREWTCAVR